MNFILQGTVVQLSLAYKDVTLHIYSRIVVEFKPNSKIKLVIFQPTDAQSGNPNLFIELLI